MKLPCPVVRDLLPLYAENMVEPETRSLMEQHLAECPDCRRKLAEPETEKNHPIETARPLQLLKKEIRKRRLYTAAVASLCVFIAVFAWFCRESSMQPVSWEDGLVEVKGIEDRPYVEVSGKDAGVSDTHGSTAEVLVLKVSGRISGTQQSIFIDDDGTATVILQGWTSQLHGGSLVKDRSEMVLYPVPDRVIYSSGSQQELLWGEPMNGGVEVLPRLALGYYVILAAAMAALLGMGWLIFRKRKCGPILRQAFFAPLSYITAHFLIMGSRTTSFFMARDFFCILLTAAAVYALLTLSRQVWLQRKAER